MQCWGFWNSSVVSNTLELWASVGEEWQHITLPSSTQKSKLEYLSMVYQLLEVKGLKIWFIFLWCHAVIIREREDRHEIKSPVLFIFAENDNYIPLEQFGIKEPDLKFII